MQEAEELACAYRQVGDVELIGDVPTNGAIVPSLLNHTVEEADAEQKSFENLTSFSPSVEFFIFNEI